MVASMSMSTSAAVMRHERSRSSWYPKHQGWYQRLQLLHLSAKDGGGGEDGDGASEVEELDGPSSPAPSLPPQITHADDNPPASSSRMMTSREERGVQS